MYDLKALVKKYIKCMKLPNIIHIAIITKENCFSDDGKHQENEPLFKYLQIHLLQDI